MTREEITLIIEEVISRNRSQTAEQTVQQAVTEAAQQASAQTAKAIDQTGAQTRLATNQSNVEQSNDDTGNAEILELSGAFDHQLMSLNKKINADLFALGAFNAFFTTMRQQDQVFQQTLQMANNTAVIALEKLREAQ